MKKNVLVIGSGGREHALAWKIKQSPLLGELFIAPGNAGTALEGENVFLDMQNHHDVISFCKEKNIELVVVGPDDSLAAGIVDDLTAAGIAAFGPTKAAAQLEWSKAFAKSFMNRHGIPSARSETFSSYVDASTYIKNQPLPIVIKADGLALGKGVVIAQTYAEAEETLASFMNVGMFGESGKTVVIEEFLEGKEVSIHAFCDGTTAKLFPVARDHKRIGEGNTGPNTGGMGTVAPVVVPEGFLKEIENTVVIPVLKGMAAEGKPFTGVLFPGLMLTNSGFKVLEFNARFGDPETQSYMRLLESDLLEIMLACIEKRLFEKEIKWSNKNVCTVVLASGGYPGKYETGFPITGFESIEDVSVVIFHAGTTYKDENIITSGGRVLGISAIGSNLEYARSAAYIAAKMITFEGKYYRSDIGL